MPAGSANCTRQAPFVPAVTAEAPTLTPPTLTTTLDAAGTLLKESKNPTTVSVTVSFVFAGCEPSTAAPELFTAAVMIGGGGSTCISTGGSRVPSAAIICTTAGP